MITLGEIRDAIVDETQSLTPILRKAKIFAHRLGNKDFKDWVNWELSGYPKETEVPGYRKIRGKVLADGIPISDLTPIPIFYNFQDSISKVDDFLRENSDNFFVFSVNSPHIEEFKKGTPFRNVEIHVPRSAGLHMLEMVRNRLLDIVLELGHLYPEHDMIPKPTTQHETQQVEQIIQTHITVNHNGGELNMSTFDQRQQQVQGNQYNAARDINFGEVKTREDFLDALNDLRKQVESVQPTNDETEIAVDIKANLEKAFVEANKENPDKGKIRKFLDKASEFAKTTAAFAGMVTIFHKAAEALQALLF